MFRGVKQRGFGPSVGFQALELSAILLGFYFNWPPLNLSENSSKGISVGV